MAGSGHNLVPGLKCGLTGGDADGWNDEVIIGYGAISTVTPANAVYIKMDATMGTSSHYRNAAGTWTAMSDDS